MDDDDLDEFKNIDWEGFEDFEEALQEIQNVICMDSDKFALDVLQTALIEHIFENMNKTEGEEELKNRIGSMKSILSTWYDSSEEWNEFERREKIRLVVSNDKKD